MAPSSRGPWRKTPQARSRAAANGWPPRGRARTRAASSTDPRVRPTEETEILGLCRLMQRLRIHRVPIVKEGEISGIVSSLDIVGEVANGTKF